ncbi:hypothetical protein AAC387_Pa10g0916 [Persea americana]
MKGEGDLLKSREDPGSLPVSVAVCILVHYRRKTALLLLTTAEGGWDGISPSLSVGCCCLGPNSRVLPSLGKKTGAEVNRCCQAVAGEEDRSKSLVVAAIAVF